MWSPLKIDKKTEKGLRSIWGKRERGNFKKKMANVIQQYLKMTGVRKFKEGGLPLKEGLTYPKKI